MEVIQTTMSMGVTINLGNYQSFRLDESITAQLEEDDTLDEVRAELRLKLSSALSQDVASLKKVSEGIIERASKGA